MYLLFQRHIARKKSLTDRCIDWIKNFSSEGKFYLSFQSEETQAFFSVYMTILLKPFYSIQMCNSFNGLTFHLECRMLPIQDNLVSYTFKISLYPYVSIYIFVDYFAVNLYLCEMTDQFRDRSCCFRTQWGKKQNHQAFQRRNYICYTEILGSAMPFLKGKVLKQNIKYLLDYLIFYTFHIEVSLNIWLCQRSLTLAAPTNLLQLGSF